jgi:hypothetical protein
LTGYEAESGSPFLLLRFHFTVYTESRDRANLEARVADIITTFLTDSEITLVDTIQGIIDFVDQLTLPIPDTQFETAVGFLGGPVGRIRKIG